MAQYPPDIWTWRVCGDALRSLPGRNGFPAGDHLSLLGYELDVSDGSIKDRLSGEQIDETSRDGRQVTNTLFYVLSAYAKPDEKQLTGKLITSKQFRGASFTECVMTRERHRISTHFKDPSVLVSAASALSGSQVDFQYGDVAVELNMLPLIPITIVLTLADSEFPADARLFYDESVEQYFDSEQAYFITSLTVSRLIWLSNLISH